MIKEAGRGSFLSDFFSSYFLLSFFSSVFLIPKEVIRGFDSTFFSYEPLLDPKENVSFFYWSLFDPNKGVSDFLSFNPSLRNEEPFDPNNEAPSSFLLGYLIIDGGTWVPNNYFLF